MIENRASVVPAIETKGVHKSFLRGKERAHVLQGVDLEVGQGECLFLVGPSGSGKSTLLAILGSILTPDAGEVRLLGENIERLSARERTRLRRDVIGFVFQRFHLVRGLTALENVCIPLLLRGETERPAKRKAKEILTEVGLAGHLNADPRRMSSGQCQRVAIARALVSDPVLLFADEPTASLDEESGRASMDLLSRLMREHRKTAIVVTHDVRIFDFADRILHMENGKLVAHNAPAAEHLVSESAA